jgi:hypothetical protein
MLARWLLDCACAYAVSQSEFSRGAEVVSVGFPGCRKHAAQCWVQETCSRLPQPHMSIRDAASSYTCFPTRTNSVRVHCLRQMTSTNMYVCWYVCM